MKPTIKKVAAIHDMSGVGRCALTNIIPVLSTMGVQVCPVPTAIMSTHSGGFDDYTFHDLTDVMSDYTRHWKKLGLDFDCVYSGFLGSPRQADIVRGIIEDFRTVDNLIVVDPVMGDSGELYNSVAKEMIPQMRRLIASADITVPNYTEAAFLLGEEMPAQMGEAQAKEWLRRLSDMGPGIALITSIPDGQEKLIHTVAYERSSDRFWRVSAARQPSEYPGTGDIFASVLIGSLLRGDSLPIAMDMAGQFISQCIKSSRSYDYPARYGVLLEKELHLLNADTRISEYEEF